VVADWSNFPASGSAVAPLTGPFPFRPFLETVWKHRTEADSELHTTVGDAGAVALAVGPSGIEFAGQENLTDYHSPLGANPSDVLTTAFAAHSGSPFRFDSLPEAAADAVESAIRSLGGSVDRTEHDLAAVLHLPDSEDEWLADLRKKERHEVRRKRRNFESEFGPIEIVSGGAEHVDAFCAMHRTAPGDKGEFMTDAMEAYFSDLVTSAGAVIHLLVCDSRPLAAAFGFEVESGYFYYNSALDFDAAHASPGVVLFSTMIA